MLFRSELLAFVDRKGTRWRLALLPLGGYVKFHGDANAASAAAQDPTVVMPEAERRISFFTQPVWKRAAIVAAGPIANFILSIVIFSGIYLWHGQGMTVPRIDSVQAGSPAEGAGFLKGAMVPSPMGRAISAFASPAVAEQQRAVLSGAVATWRELLAEHAAPPGGRS